MRNLCIIFNVKVLANKNYLLYNVAMQRRSERRKKCLYIDLTY
nr:MAG TPA: hypothetical protein [Caudoviricetes sp.]